MIRKINDSEGSWFLTGEMGLVPARSDGYKQGLPRVHLSCICSRALPLCIASCSSTGPSWELCPWSFLASGTTSHKRTSFLMNCLHLKCSAIAENRPGQERYQLPKHLVNYKISLQSAALGSSTAGSAVGAGGKPQLITKVGKGEIKGWGSSPAWSAEAPGLHTCLRAPLGRATWDAVSSHQGESNSICPAAAQPR